MRNKSRLAGFLGRLAVYFMTEDDKAQLIEGLVRSATRAHLADLQDLLQAATIINELKNGSEIRLELPTLLAPGTISEEFGEDKRRMRFVLSVNSLHKYRVQVYWNLGLFHETNWLSDSLAVARKAERAVNGHCHIDRTELQKWLNAGFTLLDMQLKAHGH